MHPLYQRLRELDWDTFQRLSFQLMSAKHPGLKVRHVDGAGGDRGLDLFDGQLKDSPTIWQCKHFPNGLGPKQRPQVKESLRTALKYFKPAQWILVLSVDLDRKGHEWFQKLQASYAEKTAVGLYQGSDAVRDLIRLRDIREAFFPGAVFDTIAVARAIKGLDDSSLQKVDHLATEQMDTLIAKLEQADARFNYQIVYGPNVGAEIAENPPKHPLLVASMLDQNKRIDVFARDIDALRLDPPKLNFTLKGSGVTKFQEFLRTGKRQEFETTEVSTPTSSLDFILPQPNMSEWRLILEPAAFTTNKVIPLRVTFSHASEQVLYELMQFRVTSGGTEQVEIESISPLPFVLRFTLPRNLSANGSFTVQERFQGADVRSVSKALRAISLLRTGGAIELYALEIEKPIGTLNTALETSVQRGKWEELILDAARVSELFEVDLRVPKRITKADLESLTILMAIGDGKPLPFEALNANLIKTREHEAAVADAIGKKLHVMAQFPRLEPKPFLFGSSIDTGPIWLMAGEASINNERDFIDRYKKAQYGDGVPVRFNIEDVRAKLGDEPAAHLYFKPVAAGEPGGPPNTKRI